MLRLIGILTGSALAVAFLIIALGLPRLSPPELAQAAGEPEPEVTAEVAPVEAEPVAEESPPPVEAPVAEAPEPALSDAETEALIEQIFSPQPEPVAADVHSTKPVAHDDNWYAFWSPFRSEIAAQGFVAKLQEATGIDYRVVKVKTGIYEVAFAYEDDADIQDKLARISDATGLDMTGG
jgi:hypothetical protein